jgi:hypothetical protein
MYDLTWKVEDRPVAVLFPTLPVLKNSVAEPVPEPGTVTICRSGTGTVIK